MAGTTILLLAGTGKIASRIARKLSLANLDSPSHQKYHILLASRSTSIGSTSSTIPSSRTGLKVKFDWQDSSTFINPFSISEIEDIPPISVIFLVAPPFLDGFPPMKELIDLAVKRSVRRLVLLSGSVLEVGDGPLLGRIGDYVRSVGVEWVILRSTWFMENLSEMQHVDSIRDENRIISAAGPGKLPFVSADDIAEVAYRALTDETSHNTTHLLLGPQLLSYDMVSEILSDALGRKISHEDITEAELAAGMCEAGLPEDYAIVLAQLDTAIREGAEARTNDVLPRLLGRPPILFEEYVKGCVSEGVWDRKDR
ncbi:hypothetical protein BP6252_13315 [Coleophoma cylindrospora]|uniref:NmrA-like domain-containing protein n=1 Tax=Coleophoma cylindrospora TaxID=1849047 RepID=A0A3D8QAQ2_9HELO|nr:hypothetical protein BP6252_13315 [Coleophoma cylindrospora]